MNHFIACASVLERHVILISDTGQMLYAGPLAGVSEVDFNRATTSLVSPATLAWIKDRADAVVAARKVRLV